MKLFFVLCLLVEAQAYQWNEGTVEEEYEGPVDKYDRLDDLLRLIFGYSTECLRYRGDESPQVIRADDIVAMQFYRKVKQLSPDLQDLYIRFYNVFEEFGRYHIRRAETKETLIDMWKGLSEDEKEELQRTFIGFELIDDMANNRTRSHNEY
ncbi:hypothetical protein GCK32_005196 [Trichostrongylus colubriformis]|uniref:Uncharacterized protein n=1 Tax=Trichostrongylus colubriformis TaxID=6319 RepID=A0AAN8J1R0_TRICO